MKFLVPLLVVLATSEADKFLKHSDFNNPHRNTERVQKAAMRITMGTRYQGYREALKDMNLDSLEEMRKKMALKFIKKSLTQEIFSRLFPLTLNNHHEKEKP